MKNKSENISSCFDENDIAVIGMAGRFPGADNLKQFWENLQADKESISHFNEKELKYAGVPATQINDPRYVKARGILNNIEQFDADFFGITPYDAKIMDPQHRIFLEVCWEALETAGYSSDKLKELIGVFAGMSDNTYLQTCLLKNQEFTKKYYEYQTKIANSMHFLATKTSYYLNLRGPSININTACSTSLVAIIQACQSLITGECDIAIAGGSAIRVPQVRGYCHQEGGIYSKDGHCRAFDAKATGTVSGNAVAVVILKRLKDAIEDKDTIDAVIKSYAINNDGATKAGYVAPSPVEQSRCIATALAKVDAESISYVEAHGTGTFLGDPIEIAALTKAFRHYTQKKHYCVLGSVKTNIGHTDTASGVVGFIKAVLALKNKVIPGSLHFEKLNPKISLADSPFYVNKASTPWHSGMNIRRAGVSSFGIGGTNAHLILEEFCFKKESHTQQNAQIIILSAKTKNALIAQQENLLNYVKGNEVNPQRLANIAYTLQMGRKEFYFRKVFICCNGQRLIEQLETGRSKQKTNKIKELSVKARVAFLLSDQTALYSGAVKHIYHNNPLFHYYTNKYCQLLETNHREGVINYISGVPANQKKSTLAYIKYPALFIIQYSLSKTLMKWGIRPEALLGCDLGEYAAFCLSEIISINDAIRLTSIHGKLIDENQANEEIFDLSLLDQAISSEYKQALENISLNSPKIPIISNVKGGYLSKSLSRPELIFKSYSLLLKNESNTFIEIGAGSNLIDLAYQHNIGNEAHFISCLPDEKDCQRDAHAQMKCLQKVVATCWLLKIPISWSNYNRGELGSRIPLPAYPFERKKYWISADKSMSDAVEQYHLYEKYWEFSDLKVGMPLPAQKKWLVFQDRCGLSERFVEYLKSNKQQVVCVKKGKDFVKLTTNIFQINPNNKKNYIRLFEDLSKSSTLPDYFIYHWSICKKYNFVNDTYSNGNDFISLVYFSQVFLSNKSLANLSITIIANHIVKVSNNDLLVPERTTLLGAAMVIPQEYATVTCRVVDVGVLNKNLMPVERLVDESLHTSKDYLVAYRNGIRLVRKFKPKAAHRYNQRISFKHQGVYLILGGLGRIGLTLAKYLSRHYTANLWLVARSSPRQESHSIIDEIRHYSSYLNVFQADVSDETQMENLFDAIMERHKKIDGIFYLAASLNEATHTLTEKITQNTILDQFSPKMNGIKVIESIINKLPVDFCMLFSSISTILGGIGLASYSAANCFLDACAENHGDDEKTRWTSVNWDAWDFLSEDKKFGNSRKLQMKDKLKPNLALQLLDKNLGVLLSCHNIVIALNNLNQRINDWINPAIGLSPFDDDNLTVHRENEIFDYKNEENIQKILEKIFSDCLGVDHISGKDNFYDLGGDSLSAIHLLEVIQKTFSARIELSDLIDKDISSLAALIGRHKISLLQPFLVALKKSGDKSPVFLIHPVSGMVFCYLDLVKHINEYCPCYGIQDPSIDSCHPPFNTLEAMAKEYILKIKSLQPQGPYLIVGFSFGANVAFELVRQLEDTGEKVHNLLIIDGWASLSKEMKSPEKFENSIKFTLDQMKEQIPNVVTNKKHLIKSAWQRMQLLFYYEIKKIKTPIVLFKAKRILPEYTAIDEETNHWRNCSSSSITVYHVDADHRTILKSKNAMQIAAVINKMIME